MKTYTIDVPENVFNVLESAVSTQGNKVSFTLNEFTDSEGCKNYTVSVTCSEDTDLFVLGMLCSCKLLGQ